MSSKHMAKGFTLIELLVVIAIISLLASLLLAVFSRVRESGRSTSCQSNLKQIALAMQQYVGDNAGIYPYQLRNEPIHANQPLPVSPSPDGWASKIQPYLKSSQVFKCPSQGDERYVREDTEYAYNANLSGLSEARLNHSSTTILNLDWQPLASWSGTNILFGYGSGLDELASGVRRHSGGCNYSFADGHVKWLRPQSIPFCSDLPPVMGTMPPSSTYTFCALK